MGEFFPSKESDILRLIREIGASEGRQLSDSQCAALCKGVLPFFPENGHELQQRRVIENYQRDCEEVAALRNRMHPQHDEKIKSWILQTVQILQSKNLLWVKQAYLDQDDIVMAAVQEFVVSLESFRYGSRLSTWAYRVISQSAQRTIRDTRAQKRSGDTTPLEDEAEPALPASETEHPEQIALGREFMHIIRGILQAQRDDRLWPIFDLAVNKDMRTDDIATFMNLHPSRIRALLKQAREILQTHPAIRDWLGGNAASN